MSSPQYPSTSNAIGDDGQRMGTPTTNQYCACLTLPAAAEQQQILAFIVFIGTAMAGMAIAAVLLFWRRGSSCVHSLMISGQQRSKEKDATKDGTTDDEKASTARAEMKKVDNKEDEQLKSEKKKDVMKKEAEVGKKKKSDKMDVKKKSGDEKKAKEKRRKKKKKTAKKSSAEVVDENKPSTSAASSAAHANAKKEKKQMPVVDLLPPDIWADVIRSTPLLGLANGLSLANRQLHELCVPKLYEERPRVVNPLTIEERKEDEDDDDEEEDKKKKKDSEDDDEKGEEEESSEDEDEDSSAEEEEEEESDDDNDDGTEDEADKGEKKDGKKKKVNKHAAMKKKEDAKKRKEDKSKKKKDAEEDSLLRVRRSVWDSEMSELKEVPLARVPPPANIRGFRKIIIRRVLNDQVLAFLRNIRPMLADNSVPVVIPDRSSSCSKLKFAQLIQLFELLTGKVASLTMQEEHFLDPFWKHLRPFLLSVQFLMFDEATWNEHILVPVLARWLRWPRPDGQPRYFYVRWNANQCSPLIRLLRESFNTAQDQQPTTSSSKDNPNNSSNNINGSSYIIEFDTTNMQVDDEQPPEPFTLRNGLNERLVLGRGHLGHGGNGIVGDGTTLLLRRFPALPATIADDWMRPTVERGRSLLLALDMESRLRRRCQLDADGNVEESPLNFLQLEIEWIYQSYH